MRRAELTRLKINDINSQRLVVHVRAWRLKTLPIPAGLKKTFVRVTLRDCLATHWELIRLRKELKLPDKDPDQR